MLNKEEYDIRPIVITTNCHYLSLLVKLKADGMKKCFCKITVQGQNMMMMLFLMLLATHS